MDMMEGRNVYCSIIIRTKYSTITPTPSSYHCGFGGLVSILYIQFAIAEVVTCSLDYYADGHTEQRWWSKLHPNLMNIHHNEFITIPYIYSPTLNQNYAMAPKQRPKYSIQALNLRRVFKGVGHWLCVPHLDALCHSVGNALTKDAAKQLHAWL